MAYAALGSIAQVLDQGMSVIAEGPRENLLQNIAFLREFLRDFPRKGFQGINPLEDRIRDVAYPLQDIIEALISTSISRLRVGESFSPPTEFYSLFEWTTTKMEAMVVEAKLIQEAPGNENLSLHHSSTSLTPRRQPKANQDMVGFDEDLSRMKDRAVGGSSKLQIIPIVGMGGIGKTTLARNVYEDRLIEEYFDLCCWATVSQDYKIASILCSILSTSREEDVELLIERVHKMLKGRRYLVVLDDVWHGEPWDYVRRSLPDDENGSRVILTTRTVAVAAYVDPSSHVHQIQLLNGDHSWTLLEQTVFTQEFCPPHLEEIGKTIARNCKGLPLAIVVIAGVLKANQARDYWEDIGRHTNVATTADDDDGGGDLSMVFSLSYNNLPPHLKACFLYFGMFPEDHDISTNKLTTLWVAEGFIEGASVSKSIEEVAKEYLEDLVERSLIMVHKKGSSGIIESCRIHDVLRELCLKQAHQEKFLQCIMLREGSARDIKNTDRRIAIHKKHVLNGKEWFEYSPLRSILCFCTDELRPLEVFSLLTFRLLRVLDGILFETRIFWDAVFKLIHLRFLGFTFRDYVCSIPDKICMLENLQTLHISSSSPTYYWWSKLFLPIQIWMMPQLRHLVFSSGVTVLPFPHLAIPGRSDIGFLRELQALSTVMNFTFSKDVIKKLPNVKKLNICYMDVPDPEELSEFFSLENLVHLHQLEELGFDYRRVSRLVTGRPTLRSLTFPGRLKRLSLSGCTFTPREMSTIGSLTNLEALKLAHSSFAGGEWEPLEGQFIALKHLDILMAHDLVSWRAESTHFPCLRTLSIRWCPRLKEVPLSLGDVPTLERLTVEHCGKGAADSARLIQEEQQSLENEMLRVIIN